MGLGCDGGGEILVVMGGDEYVMGGIWWWVLIVVVRWWVLEIREIKEDEGDEDEVMNLEFFFLMN